MHSARVWFFGIASERSSSGAQEEELRMGGAVTKECSAEKEKCCEDVQTINFCARRPCVFQSATGTTPPYDEIYVESIKAHDPEFIAEGPNGPTGGFQQALTMTVTTSADANSRGTQSVIVNVTNLGATGEAQYRVAKTEANGNWVNSYPIDLTRGKNVISVAGVAFERSVNIQFNADLVFDLLVVNGVQLYPPSTAAPEVQRQRTSSKESCSSGRNARMRTIKAYSCFNLGSPVPDALRKKRALCTKLIERAVTDDWTVWLKGGHPDRDATPTKEKIDCQKGDSSVHVLCVPEYDCFTRYVNWAQTLPNVEEVVGCMIVDRCSFKNLFGDDAELRTIEHLVEHGRPFGYFSNECSYVNPALAG